MREVVIVLTANVVARRCLDDTITVLASKNKGGIAFLNSEVLRWRVEDVSVSINEYVTSLRVPLQNCFSSGQRANIAFYVYGIHGVDWLAQVLNLLISHTSIVNH